MDGRLTRQQLFFCLPLIIFAAPCLAYNEQAPRAAPPLTQLNLASFTPRHWRVNDGDLFTHPPSRYQLHIELNPRGSTDQGKQRFSAYPSLQLTPQHSLGLFHRFSPRFNIEHLGLQTAVHFRGDGIKLNFRPTAISTRLEFDLKITDGESRLDLTYRY